MYYLQGAGQRLRIQRSGKLAAPPPASKITDPLDRVDSTGVLRAGLSSACSSSSLGARLPGGPIPIVDFALNEIEHDDSDVGIPPSDTILPPSDMEITALRCAGNPPPRAPDPATLQTEAPNPRDRLRALEERGVINGSAI